MEFMVLSVSTSVVFARRRPFEVETLQEVLSIQRLPSSFVYEYNITAPSSARETGSPRCT